MSDPQPSCGECGMTSQVVRRELDAIRQMDAMARQMVEEAPASGADDAVNR